MKQIFLKVYPNGKTTTNASVLNFDRENKSGEIVIDYSEVDFLDWEKQLDLIFSDGTTAFVTGSGNTLSVPLLESYLKKGSMTVQPVAKRLVGSEYEKAKWQVVALSVRDSLNVLENDVTVTISIAEQMQAEIDEFKHAEALRVLSEIDRENAETLRLSNESSRETNESTRQLNESVRVDNEASRISAEANRVVVEQDRVSAESGRVIAEQGRASAESSRGVAETNRANAENVRVDSEATRVTAESTRISNENTRVSQESARNVWEEYNALTSYVVGNKVSYLGSSYRCILASTGNLPTNTTYWLLIASKGDTGATGATGATGEQGIPGGNITNASELPFTPTGNLSSTNVQNALVELDSNTNAQLADMVQNDYLIGDRNSAALKAERLIDISEWQTINGNVSVVTSNLQMDNTVGVYSGAYIPTVNKIRFKVTDTNKIPFIMVGYNETSMTAVGVSSGAQRRVAEFPIGGTAYTELLARNTRLAYPTLNEECMAELDGNFIIISVKKIGSEVFVESFRIDLSLYAGASGWLTNPQLGLLVSYSSAWIIDKNVYAINSLEIESLGGNLTDAVLALGVKADNHDQEIEGLQAQVNLLTPETGGGRWFGKTINILGDSFTQRNLFPPHIKSALGLGIVNLYGSSGDTIAVHPLDASPMSVRYTAMTNTADLILVEGGVNDYGNGAFGSQGGVPIGTNADTVNTTFKGALKILIAGLLAKYPTQKIAFVAPCQMNEANASLAYKNGLKANGLGHYLIEYVDAMKEICALYGLPCLDMYRGLGLSEGNMVGWTLDGLHLNELGSGYYGLKIAEWLKGI